jgi:hypothetical protein
VQVSDDYGRVRQQADGRDLRPGHAARSPAKQAGEWQAFDITLIGRRVTVVLNGTTVLDNAEIPGITGGALDSAEGAPGPIMLQGITRRCDIATSGLFLRSDVASSHRLTNPS